MSSMRLAFWKVVLALIAPIARRSIKSRHEKDFVHIEEDGTYRELTQGEVEFLGETFEHADSARPYIKTQYRSLTPAGSIAGFLERRLLPRDVCYRRNSD